MCKENTYWCCFARLSLASYYWDFSAISSSLNWDCAQLLLLPWLLKAFSAEKPQQLNLSFFEKSPKGSPYLELRAMNSFGGILLLSFHSSAMGARGCKTICNDFIAWIDELSLKGLLMSVKEYLINALSICSLTMKQIWWYQILSRNYFCKFKRRTSKYQLDMMKMFLKKKW